MTSIKLLVFVMYVLGCANARFGIPGLPMTVPAPIPVPIPNQDQFNLLESVPVPIPAPELDMLNFPMPIPELTSLLSSMEPVETFVNQLLDIMMRTILFLEYSNVPTKEIYRTNYTSPEDGSYHEEVGILTNPGTRKEELVKMGADSYNDGEIETTTMYTSDKNGYKPRVQTKRRGISPKLRSSVVG